MIEELNFDLDIPDMDFDISISDNGFDNRYMKSKVAKEIPAHKLKYSNALKLAKKIKIYKGIRYDVIVSGNFIFGYFIEAFITSNNAKCLQLTISTLSLDQNNVDSLVNLMKGNYVDQLNLIISDYFYAHKRGSLIPYIYDNLDKEDRVQLASASSHTKITMFETLGGNGHSILNFV